MGEPELDAMAQRVIDGNHYMTLATLDRGGRPRVSEPARSGQGNEQQAQHHDRPADEGDDDLLGDPRDRVYPYPSDQGRPVAARR